jgi:hypothetical protein
VVLYFTVSRLSLRPAQSPIKWVLGAYSWAVKRPGREDDHSPPSCAEIKKFGPVSLFPMRLHGVTLNYMNTGTRLGVSLPIPIPAGASRSLIDTV